MGTIIFGGKSVNLTGVHPVVGDVAPDFKAHNFKFESVSLHDFAGKTVLISSFPSIDTPVCELQTKRFNKEASLHKNIKLISISCDLPFAQHRFCAAENISDMTILSDAAWADFGIKYGLLISSFRLLARSVIIIDKEGIIRYIEIVSDVSHEPNYDNALKVLESLE